ncbi:MAG: response regulator [Spirochaetaceae bacterium]|jgi:putative two-component system response regulator|nr:response regulator [Spirochaetaceae bacterium]
MPKQILVVDDNLSSLKQIGAQLTPRYEISLAKSGAIALQICKQEKPDLILLDIEMPEMDGFETIRQLKADPELNPIPVIFLTGNRDMDTEIKALQSGAMDFIAKPANKDILLHRLELHLQFSAYQTSLEHTVMELENSIVASFAELIECKDHNVGGHVLRTGKYVELIGKELLAAGTFGEGFTETDLNRIVRAAPFHDIGKVGISDVLLLKQEQLTDIEYDEVKKHTTIGAQFLQKIYERIPGQDYLELAIQLAQSHHERYDGRGYPEGLAGDDIPLCARILAVANVYDACLTDRVYRKAMDCDDVFQIILEEKGRAFDPRVVDAFEAVKDALAGLDIKTLPMLKIEEGRLNYA